RRSRNRSSETALRRDRHRTDPRSRRENSLACFTGQPVTAPETTPTRPLTVGTSDVEGLTIAVPPPLGSTGAESSKATRRESGGSVHILAATRIEQGKIARAREAYRRMHGVRIEEPEDAAVVHGIAGTLFQIGGKRREAEDEYLAAIRSWEAAGRGEIADAASVLTALATLYVQERRLTDASQTLARVLVILQRSKDTVPVDYVKLLSVRADLRLLQHHFQEAEQDAREAIALADRESQLSVSY